MGVLGTCQLWANASWSRLLLLSMVVAGRMHGCMQAQAKEPCPAARAASTPGG